MEFFFVSMTNHHLILSCQSCNHWIEKRIIKGWMYGWRKNKGTSMEHRHCVRCFHVYLLMLTRGWEHTDILGQMLRHIVPFRNEGLLLPATRSAVGKKPSTVSPFGGLILAKESCIPGCMHRLLNKGTHSPALFSNSGCLRKVTPSGFSVETTLKFYLSLRSVLLPSIPFC